MPLFQWLTKYFRRALIWALIEELDRTGGRERLPLWIALVIVHDWFLRSKSPRQALA
jgi:hypothetical protein